MERTFEAELWKWEGEAAWYFVSLPTDVADEIEDTHGNQAGFGAVKVNVRIGGSRWSTSLFPDSKRGTYLLPVKKAVRTKEGIDDGATVTVTVEPVD